jgi:hypothetical protein
MRSRPWPRGLIVALAVAAELLVGVRLLTHSFEVSTTFASGIHTYGECLTGFTQTICIPRAMGGI